MLGPRMFKYVDDPGQWKFDVATAHGAYEALKKAVSMPREELIATIAACQIKGRGGAGFPIDRKWGTIPKNATTIFYACNADESEPGTCSNREIVENDPHQLVEGLTIASYAVGAKTAFIYIRGEYRLGAERLVQALADAEKAGYVGKSVCGKQGLDIDIWVHRGAGAYICGEETALIESLEGNRGEPRLRPPYFPTVMGLTNKPTVVNNVETIIDLVHVVNLGPEKYKDRGTEANPGTKLYCMSGNLARPGVYEAPFNVTLRELIYTYAGGIPDGRKLKAVIPGGASFQWWTEEQLDVVMDIDSVRAAGSNLGSAGVMVMDDTVCAVDAALNLVHFFAHESCGKCTPCREGMRWLEQILWRIENGRGRPGEIDQLLDICSNIGGRSFCLLGDSGIVPVQSSIKLFREEYEHHIQHKKCTVTQRHKLSAKH